MMDKDMLIPWDENDGLEALTFSLHKDVFAIEAVLVREILDLQAETRVPGAPSLVDRVINFRGKVIPIADLRLAFAMDAAKATADSRIIVVEIDLGGEPTLVGLKTDKVHEVTTLERTAAEEPPAVGMRWRRDYIRCLMRRDDHVMVLPDVQAIFSATASGPGAVPPLQLVQ
jgi:purine-binding chemotaxis protein CheW